MNVLLEKPLPSWVVQLISLLSFGTEQHLLFTMRFLASYHFLLYISMPDLFIYFIFWWRKYPYFFATYSQVKRSLI